jgi:GxxExxY protein
MERNEVTYRVIGLCMRIHSTLGPGLLESVYEEALAYELGREGIPFIRQKAIPVEYDSIRLGHGFRADLIVDGQVLVEIKSIDAIAPVHVKVVLTYLKLTGLPLGLLVNFHTANLREGLKRIIYTPPEEMTKNSSAISPAGDSSRVTP